MASEALQARYKYESFGKTEMTLDDGHGALNPFRYTGRELDETGDYYYRARYYDAELGRFVSEDPIGLLGGDVNWYGYVRNRPMYFVDPLGLMGEAWLIWGREGAVGLNNLIDKNTGDSLEPETVVVAGAMLGVPVGIGAVIIASPEIYMYLQMNPEFALGVAEFLAGYAPNSPPPSWAGYAGAFTQWLQGYIQEISQDRACRKP